MRYQFDKFPLLFISAGFLLLASFQPAQAIDYTYDELHRLVRVDYPAGQVLTYDYDATGNILTVLEYQDSPCGTAPLIEIAPPTALSAPGISANTITTNGEYIIPPSTSVTFRADRIRLLPGFHAQRGSTFIAATFSGHCP